MPFRVYYDGPSCKACNRTLLQNPGKPPLLTMEWAEDASPLPCDLVYIKVPKCASSTTGGVVRRIAAHNQLSGVHTTSWAEPEPGIWANHAPLTHKWGLLGQLQQRALLLTMVRLPATRCLSGYYHFGETRGGASNEARAKVAALKGCKNFIFNYITPPGTWSARQLVEDVYSFIGVVERYDESMVLLASLLRVPLSHVLYLKAKNSNAGGVDAKLGISFVPHPPLEQEPSAVSAFAASADFNHSNKHDYELYVMANAALDRRWRANREELDAGLARFREMRARATELCADAADNEASCYWGDNGCAYQCLDRHFGETGLQN